MVQNSNTALCNLRENPGLTTWLYCTTKALRSVSIWTSWFHWSEL